MILVVLSPHRDDAAFSLGLAVDAWLSAGHTVSILNFFTQSAYAPFSDVEHVHSNDRTSFVSALRRREDIAWSKLTNNKISFHDLDLLDAPLRLACDVDEAVTAEIRPGDRALARAEGAVAKLVRRSETREMAIVAPLAVGGHLDHRIVHQAALQACSGTSMPLAFYEDLPYAARSGEVAQLAEKAAGLGLGLQTVFATSPAEEVAAERRKLRIAECYDSQVDSATVKAIAAFAIPYGGRERLWANEAWRQRGLSREENA